MTRAFQHGIIAAAAIAICLAVTGPARADSAITGSFWNLPDAKGTVSLIIPGQAAPVNTSVSASTIFAGTCQDCMLPMEFKPDQAAKNCAVCGCAANNTTCIAGKPVKDGTWQSMLRLLPHGIGLAAIFVDPAKPESGLKKLTVNLRAVILPISGLGSYLTPDQLLALVKPIGGIRAELLDSGKLLSVTLKADYTSEKAAKLEKAISAANGKVSVPNAS